MRVVIFGKGGASREVALWIDDDIRGLIESEDISLLKSKMIEGVVIPIGTPTTKKKIYETEILPMCVPLSFPNYIHPTVIYDEKELEWMYGNILCQGVILNMNLTAGKFNLINYGCTVGHDVKMGDYNVINPQACISGGVEIGDCCLIGANATILQYLKIGDNVTVGAGAVVTKDVPSNTTVMGVPAK